jgi:hypothetical protein
MGKENVVYSYTMEYHSAIKKNEVMLLAGNECNWTSSRLRRIMVTYCS